MLQKEALKTGAEKEWASAYAVVEQYATWSDSLNKANHAYLIGRKDAEKSWKIAKLEERLEAERLAILEAEAQQWRAMWGYSLLALIVMALLSAVAVTGRLAVGARFAEMLLFSSFLMLFETLQVFTEPFINSASGGEPLWLFIFNLVLAALLTPLHEWAEKKLPALIFRGKRRMAERKRRE